MEISGTILTVEIYNPQLTRQFVEGDTVNAVLDLDCVRVLQDDALAEE